ncbi:MAG TPA: hypothetical protein VN581_07590, partial [Patescibacteria group bacterium]|nr:hypothetical protein [Patescibacteria group bacterium]
MRIVDRWILRVLALSLFALLAGCGAPPGIVRPEEPTRVTRIFTVTSPIEWARFRAYNAELWTIDGTALNRILWLVNIRDKYHVFGSTRATKRRPDGPFYRKGMDASEIEAVLRDGIIGLGLINVKTTNLQPVRIGNFTAFRFDLSFDVGNGLHYRGNMTFFERREKLNLIWYSAPAEYYHPRDA